MVALLVNQGSFPGIYWLVIPSFWAQVITKDQMGTEVKCTWNLQMYEALRAVKTPEVETLIWKQQFWASTQYWSMVTYGREPTLSRVKRQRTDDHMTQKPNLVPVTSEKSLHHHRNHQILTLTGRQKALLLEIGLINTQSQMSKDKGSTLPKDKHGSSVKTANFD